MLKFVGYYSAHSFTSSEKALMLKDINYRRIIPVVFSDKVNNFVPDMENLKNTLKKDIADGLIPIWYGATLGTTGTCAYDPIEELG